MKLFIALFLIVYMAFNAVMTVRLMSYWEATQQRKARWRDVWNILQGEWDDGMP